MGLLPSLNLYDTIDSIRDGLMEEGLTFTRLGKDIPVVIIIMCGLGVTGGSQCVLW